MSSFFSYAAVLPYVASVVAFVWGVALASQLRRRRAAGEDVSLGRSRALQAFVEAGLVLWFVNSAAWMLSNVFARSNGFVVEALVPAGYLVLVGGVVLVLVPTLANVPSLFQRKLGPPPAELRMKRLLAGRVYGWWYVALAVLWLAAVGVKYLVLA